MFNSEVIALDLANDSVNILIGSKNKVKLCESITILNENIGEEVNYGYIENKVQNFLSQNNVNTKEVLFAIHDQEVVIRHIEVPIMNKKSIRAAIDFELNQYLPGSSKNHYMDYEIINEINSKGKKQYKLLVVSVPKEKIDKYAELAQKLKLNLKAIDISANCVARVFGQVSKTSKLYNSIGIINIGSKISNIVILEKGKLFIEREVPFGINNLVREIENKKEVSTKEAKLYLQKEINLNEIDENDETQRRIQIMIDNVFASFNKVIQFYGTGRISKKLDYIYIIGEGNKVKGMDEYITRYFETSAIIVDSQEKINIKAKLPENSNLTKYIDAYGLLLRK